MKCFKNLLQTQKKKYIKSFQFSLLSTDFFFLKNDRKLAAFRSDLYTSSIYRFPYALYIYSQSCIRKLLSLYASTNPRLLDCNLYRFSSSRHRCDPRLGHRGTFPRHCPLWGCSSNSHVIGFIYIEYDRDTHMRIAFRISLKILFPSKGSWDISQMLRNRHVAPRSLPSNL